MQEQSTVTAHICPNCPDVYTFRDTCNFCRAEQYVRDAQERLRQAHCADIERRHQAEPEPKEPPMGVFVWTIWAAVGCYGVIAAVLGTICMIQFVERAFGL